MNRMLKKTLALMLTMLLFASTALAYEDSNLAGEGLVALTGAEKATVADFTYLGRDDDKVSRTSIGANNVKDGHFRLNMNFSEQTEIKALTIEGISDSLGRYGIWKTDQYPYWIAGIYRDNALLNSGYKSSLGSFSGDVEFDIYCDANAQSTPWLAQTDTYNVIVTFADGSSIKQQAGEASEEKEKALPSVREFAYLGRDDDRVGRTATGANGVSDGHFRLKMHFVEPAEVKGIQIEGQSASLGRYGIWKTDQYPYWIAGVYRGGTLLNSGYKSSLGSFSGDVELDIYCDANAQSTPWLAQTDDYTVTVYLADGRSVSQKITSASIESFAFIAWDEDKLSGNVPGISGAKDAHFRLKMNFAKPAEIESIKLRDLKAYYFSGTEIEMAWHTKSQDYWLLPVYGEGLDVPPYSGYKSTLGTFDGEKVFDIYCEPYSQTKFNQGDKFEVTVNFKDGSSVSAQTALDNVPRIDNLKFVKKLYVSPGTPCHFDIDMTIPKDKEIKMMELDIMPQGLNWSTDKYQYLLCINKDGSFINTSRASTLGSYVGEQSFLLYPMNTMYPWYAKESDFNFANNQNAIVKVTFADGSTAEKTLSLVSTPTTGFGMGGVSVFTDLPASHWAYEAVQFMQQQGVIKGYEDGTFKPDKSLTRAEFAKMLILALGEPLDDGTASFADVSAQHWAAQYVETAKKYISGESVGGQTLFRPDDAITREDVAVAIVKAKGLENMTYSESTLDGFADKSAISSDNKKYVAIAVEKGLMKGTDIGFEPQSPLTRAQVCMLFYRMLVQ